MKLKSKITKVVVTATVMGLLLTGCGGKKDVAATVNGVDIPMTTYVEEYKSAAKQIASQYGADYLQQDSMEKGKTMGEAVRENILKNIVQMEILRQDAEKSNIVVSEEETQKYIEQTQQMYGGEEAFKKALDDQGVSFEFYKEYIQRGLLMQKYTQEKMKALEPKEEELKKYFEDNKEKFQTVSAAHILVKTEEEAKAIKAELDGGADFAELAKAKSQDPGSGQQGGDLGSFGKGQMVKEFEDKVFSMKEGEISDPVKTQFGYHIIKLNKIQNDFESQKDAIKAQYVNEAFGKQVQELEKKAKVEKHADTKKEIEVELPKEVDKKETTTEVSANGKEADKKEPAAEANSEKQ